MDVDILLRFLFHLSAGACSFLPRFCSIRLKLLDTLLQVQDHFLKLQDFFFQGKVPGIFRIG